MTNDQLNRLLHDISMGGCVAKREDLIAALQALHKRETDLVNHHQGVTADLMVSLTQANETFLRLQGHIR